MSSQFLNDFLLTMPEIQRKKILELLELKQQKGFIKSDEEFQQELNRLMKDLEKYNGQPTFNPISQSGRTNSDAYNQNMNAILFDLKTLFDASSQIDQLIDDNQRISLSKLSDLQKQVQTLTAQVDKFKLLINYSNAFDDVIYEQFKIPDYQETDKTVLNELRVDRFGEQRPETYDAESDGNSLHLASFQTLDQLKTSYGKKTAQISVKNRTGLVASSTEHAIDQAIDGSIDTFWAENVIVDDTINQDIDNLWANDYNGYPKSGALCEIEIILNSVTAVSEVDFSPFTNYPLEVVSILGYEAQGTQSKVHELISPNHTNLYQRSQKSTGKMIFQFPEVNIKKLLILIRQENYVKENYIVTNDQKNNQQLWDNMGSTDQFLYDERDPDETIAEFNKKNEVTGWNVYLQKLKEWAVTVKDSSLLQAAEKALKIIQNGDYKNPLLLQLQTISDKSWTGKKGVSVPNVPELSEQWLAVNKVSYLYGAYDIGVFSKKYLDNSIYISQELPFKNNPKRLALTTEEQNVAIQVDMEHSTYVTDIEYYLAFNEHPKQENWYAILPTNKPYVQGELLCGLRNTHTINDQIEFDPEVVSFTLRFPYLSKDTVTIRRNGQPMLSNMFDLSDDGTTVSIKREFYSPASIYTADYRPVESAFYIDVNEDVGLTPMQFKMKDGTIGEHFEVADANNKITLSHLPYIFREQIFSMNDGDQSYKENTSHYTSDDMYYPIIVRVNGEEYKNITDYATNSYNQERLKENNGKCFAQINDQVIFGRSNTDLKDIQVDYYFMKTNIRLKAILRRNHNLDESITPHLYNWQLRSQTTNIKDA
jgi:hypothetical protein